jgi:hypothetical protein
MTYDGCHGRHQSASGHRYAALLIDKTIPSELQPCQLFAAEKMYYLGRWLIPAVKIHNGKLDQLCACK